MENSEFIIDERLDSSCFFLADWPLSRVLLKNSASYPWLLLIPRVASIREIDELNPEARYQLMDEISQLSTIIREYFNPEKLNVACLGNIVSQLHIHLVARFTTDKLWPHSVWQEALENKPYEAAEKAKLEKELKTQISKYFVS